jgi:hypothetical protein
MGSFFAHTLKDMLTSSPISKLAAPYDYAQRLRSFKKKNGLLLKRAVLYCWEYQKPVI